MTAIEFAESQRLQARWASATPTQRALFVTQVQRRARQPLSDKAVARGSFVIWSLIILAIGVPFTILAVSALAGISSTALFLGLILLVLLWK